MKDLFAEWPDAYGAHWSLSEMYQEHEAELRKALASGEDFEASWGVKKEIEYATVRRINGSIEVEFRTYIDELYGIADTLLWVASGKKYDSGFDYICKFHDLDPNKPADHERAESIMEEVQGWVEDEYREEWTERDSLPATATYEEIMNMIDELGAVATTASQDCYESMVETVRACIDASHEQHQAPVA